VEGRLITSTSHSRTASRDGAGRQPDVRTPSWTESPTDQEVAEAGVLLAEVGLLKERGLTAEAVVADFVFKNIQPLKEMAYPAYLYRAWLIQPG
jgi:hypothetical protein